MHNVRTEKRRFLTAFLLSVRKNTWTHVRTAWITPDVENENVKRSIRAP